MVSLCERRTVDMSIDVRVKYDGLYLLYGSVFHSECSSTFSAVNPAVNVLSVC